MKFGLIPEFVGRLPVIGAVSNLDREALVRILVEPKNALVKQYRRVFDLDNVELEITDDALEAVADQALLRGTGARALRAILEEVLLEVMYDLPVANDVGRCVVDKSVVLERVAPTLLPRAAEREARAASPRGLLSFDRDSATRRQSLTRRGLAWLDRHVNLEAIERGAAGRAALPTLERIARPPRRRWATRSAPSRSSTSPERTARARRPGWCRAAPGERALGRARYTSPHLERINERIAYDGEPISDDDLAELLGRSPSLERFLLELASDDPADLVRARHRCGAIATSPTSPSRPR